MLAIPKDHARPEFIKPLLNYLSHAQVPHKAYLLLEFTDHCTFKFEGT